MPLGLRYPIIHQRGLLTSARRAVPRRQPLPPLTFPRNPPPPSSRTMSSAPPQLPALPEVTRLAPGCIRILAGNPGKFTLQGTNTYLVGTGPWRWLIDTGEGKPSWLANLRRVLAEEGPGTALAGVLLTHWHRDHVGGVADVLREWPGTAVFKRRRADADGEEAGEAGWKTMDIADGQRFNVPGASLTAAHTPGHTTDHTVFVWEEEGALFTGDNVLGHGTSVFEDLSEYLGSLERMRGLYRGKGAGKAYPGHGAVVEDGPGKIAEYLRHRQMREDQVVQTLSEGTREEGMTVMEVVRVMYKDVPENLHPAAAHGVMQIVAKLQKEGKAVAVESKEEEEEERWKLKEPASPGKSAL
ncbi:hypothetical protein VTJ83DRAFT_2959 [Remersonia thermophila]|uniref:Metallo-beta-lactamase domain-containing protein n=1 Tax=Remersonia thermophila TaxID=72144 RepID=A0ABR4DCP1_9PEZI